MDFDVATLAEHYAQLALAAGYFAGVVLAIVFWSRQPRSCLSLLIAAGLMLGVELLFIAAWMSPDGDFDDDVFPMLNGFDLIVRLIAFGLLVAAVFTGRTPPKSSFLDLDD
jgi:hypothetical protein